MHIKSGKVLGGQLLKIIDMNKTEFLIKKINGLSSNRDERRVFILQLVDEHQSPLIIPFLVEIIRKEDYETMDSTLIYACNEYSVIECLDYFNLFISIIIYGNFEAAWTAGLLVKDMRDYFGKLSINELKTAYHALEAGLIGKNKNIELIKDVLFYITEDVIIPNNLKW